MTVPETALEIVPSHAVALLRRDGEAARDFGRESPSPATRRAYQTDVDALVHSSRPVCGRTGARARLGPEAHTAVEWDSRREDGPAAALLR